MKPCGHETSQQLCRVCRLYETDAAYKTLWDGSDTVHAETSKRTLPCMFLGPVIFHADCGCARQNIFQCALHGAVSLRRCQVCTDYQVE
jgi:hypothetical protein